jgi:rhodanese-related sulfurtransferase
MTLRKAALGTAITIAGLVLAGLTAPAAVRAQSYPDSVDRLIAATKKQIRTINMEQFKSAFDRQELGLLIDVRQEGEFAAGYVPGAVNVPRGVIEFHIWKLVGFPDRTDMSRQLTLYCATGGRCALAAKSLQDLGFTNVTSVDMMFSDWVGAGHPVVKPAK